LEKLLLQDKREQLEMKILQVFQEEMGRLSRDLQQVLADDLVTAFVNRVAVFTEIQSEASVPCPEKRTLNP
jgi:hypothetical protein